MSEIENKLHVKEDIIKSLIEKVKVVEERQENFKMESQEVSKSEQTFINTSDESKNCNNCALQTISEEEIRNHVETVHVKKFNCEFCNFQVKQAGLSRATLEFSSNFPLRTRKIQSLVAEIFNF